MLNEPTPFVSTSFNMGCGVRPVNPYAPAWPSSHLDTLIQNPQTIHDPYTWILTLTYLRNQQGYLDDLLSKTAIRLNALRDRQSRNDRILSTHPGPRSKRKKMLQNRWRTGKTIQTCENEERAILGCLQVCKNNIQILESINLASASRVTDYNPRKSKYSNTESSTMNLHCDSWADDVPTSPSREGKQHAFVLGKILPECLQGLRLGGPLAQTTTAATNKRPPSLPPRVHIAPSSMQPPSPPPNTARPHIDSLLSPEAICFEPSVTHTAPNNERPLNELDKLSISGLLASKHMLRIQKQRFPDATIGHIFRRLSVDAKPGHGRERKSWGPDGQQYHVKAARWAPTRKRTRSF